MGCQTTNTTPKDTSPVPEPVEHTEQNKQEGPSELLIEPQKSIQTLKPIFCADIESVHQGLEDNSGESPLMIWKDAVNGYTTMLWVNKEKETATVIEYAGPNMACFTAVGIDVQINDEGLKTKGTPILFKKVLD
jgi:hypothetical protein